MSLSNSTTLRGVSPTPPPTPASAALSLAPLKEKDATATYVKDVLGCYSTISSFSDLQPSPQVNDAFEKLVALCIQIKDESIVKSVLADRQVSNIMPHLQSLCAAGEFRLETFWANKLASVLNTSSQTPTATLSLFPYYENYLYLTRLEFNAISSCFPISPSFQPRKFAFIGCGPLPLTSFCLFNLLSSLPHLPHYPVVASKSTPISGFPHACQTVRPLCAPDDQGIQILNIDHNPSAIALAASICRKLQYPLASFRFLCAEAEDLTRHLTAPSTLVAAMPTPTPLDNGSGACDLSAFDVVYLAALVGNSGVEKGRILRNIVSRMRPGALVVVRSAWGLRGLVYPVVNAPQDIEAEGLLEVLLVVHPYNHIVNSVVVARVRACTDANAAADPVLIL